MMKYMPVVLAFSADTISFKVTILYAKSGLDNIHTMYGGGSGVFANVIGEASLILKRNTQTNKKEVLYLDGYIKPGEGCKFCVQTEKEIIEACRKASMAIWR